MAFLVPFSGVAGHWFQSIMSGKHLKTIGKDSIAMLPPGFDHWRSQVVDPQLPGDTAQLFEQYLQAFQKALLVFRRERNRVTCVTEWKTHDKAVNIFYLSVLYGCCGAEVDLGFDRRMGQPVLFFFEGILTLEKILPPFFREIAQCPVRAGKPQLFQLFEYDLVVTPQLFLQRIIFHQPV